MNMLLDDMVAGEFDEIEPVMVHIGCVGFARTPTFEPRHRAVPLDDPTPNSANRTRINQSLVLQVRGGVPALRTGNHGQALRLGLLAGGDDGAGADGIDGDRLLNEAVLAGIDGGGEMHRAECRRGRHEHEGAIRGHHLLIGIITREKFGGGKFVNLSEFLDLVFKGIS